MSDLRWDDAWRARTWEGLDGSWDLLVIGGGISGAGVLRAAARAGLRALLLEQQDFAWGASSRSTKLVHGGLRYLAQGHLRLTRESVVERERLLGEAPGLVTPVPFLLPLYKGQLRRHLEYISALQVYEALAGRVRRHGVGAGEVALLAPALHRQRLRGGLGYLEAQTDDARLVLRVLRQAVAAGAVALNAAKVTTVLRSRGRVCGVEVLDRLTGRTGDVRAAVVVNATGSWADVLRREVDGPPRMRPVRGSHLLFAGWRFPLATGVNVRSPRDGRHVSVLPWEGATLVGTTDLDSTGDLDDEAAITSDEVHYLLECLQDPFRSLQLTEDDVVSTWSGVRPLVSSGAAASGDELRGHVVWDERGLLTATGGKLTTFGVLARDVLRAAAPHLPRRDGPVPGSPVPVPADEHGRRLAGRYAGEAEELVAGARPDEWESVAGTPTTWAELRWSARCEGVTSLDDLMLRRTRLGLLLPRGGEQVLDRVRAVCADELGWDCARWQAEWSTYAARIRDSYTVPSGTSTVSPSGTASTVTGRGPTGSPSA